MILRTSNCSVGIRICRYRTYISTSLGPQETVNRVWVKVGGQVKGPCRSVHEQPGLNTDLLPHSGVQGGSDLCNSQVEEVVRAQLSRHAPRGVIASIMQRFEERKWRYDYTLVEDSGNDDLDEEDVIIPADNGKFQARLRGRTIRRALRETFAPGVQLVKSEAERLLGLGRPFVVLLCGGSYRQPGLRKVMGAYLTSLEERARARGITVKHAFLGDLDPNYWYVYTPGHRCPWMVLSNGSISLGRLLYPRELRYR